MSVYQVATKKYDAEKKAVKSAMKRNGRIITDNLDNEFNNAIKNKSSKEYYANNLSVNNGGFSKLRTAGMTRSASGFSVDRVFDVPHNPFRTRQAIETPQNIADLYQRFRYYYQREPLVGTAIDLHTQFPLSKFRLSHEDSVLRDEFNDIAEDLNLFEFMLDMAHEYWLTGEAFAFGIFDDNKTPQCWKAFTLLNPLYVDIKSVDITDGRPRSKYRLRISQNIKDIVSKGAYGDTSGLYDRIPQDLKTSASSDGFLELNDIQISHFKRKSNYFKVRGESILYRIIHLLSYRDKLRDALWSQADRNITPREVWKIGETNAPATEDELQAFSDMLSDTYLDPSQAIVWHHAVSVDVLNTMIKVAPIRQELDQIEEEMLIGLMLNKGFLDSNYGAYANMSVALDVLISRYLTFRDRIERWQQDHVWAPLCRIHNIYKPTQAELEHRIRVKGKRKRPYVPDIVWDKHELRDSTQKVNLYMQLREKLGVGARPGFPRKLIYQAVNEDPATIKKMLDDEQKEDKLHGIVPEQGEAGAGAFSPADLGSDIGDIGDLGALDEEIGEIPGEETPESDQVTTELSPGTEVQPPGAGEVQEFGTGEPGGTI